MNQNETQFFEQGEEEEEKNSYQNERPYSTRLASRRDKIEEQEPRRERFQFFLWTYLRELDQLPLDTLKTELTGYGTGLIEKINGSRIEEDSAFFYVSILSKLIVDRDAPLSAKILSSFVESEFLTNMKSYLQTSVKLFVKNIAQRQHFFDDLISLLSSLMDLYPSRIYTLPLYELRYSIIAFNIKLNALHKEKLLAKFKELDEKFYVKVEEFEKSKVNGNKDRKKGFRGIKFDQQYKTLPTTDFKEIEVIPGVTDLNERKPKSSIRKMPEEGDLISKHNYLDLLFRLLHEDAINDLREGVIMMTDIGSQEIKPHELRQRARAKQIKLHLELTVSKLEVLDGVGCVQFRLPADKKNFLDWRISKKLLPGSLVIMSHDYFKTIFIGLLKNRDSKSMNKTHQKFGYVPINIEIIKSNVEVGSLYDFYSNYGNELFTVIESSAYFESYKHVLTKLKQIDEWDRLPMERYFVNSEFESHTPEYMQDILYDHEKELLQCIADSELDESQVDALYRALFRDLALIQGPPGTGKTYIGVQLVRILLKFKRYWKGKGPILIVTYTNHALNQFLMLVKKYTDKIVRIGGRYDEELASYGLREWIRTGPSVRGFYPIRKDIKKETREFCDCRNDMIILSFGFITNLLDWIDDACVIMEKLVYYFSDYFRRQMDKSNISGDLRKYVIDAIQHLRQHSRENILPAIWLGIFDLHLFFETLKIQFEKSKTEEEVKPNVKYSKKAAKKEEEEKEANLRQQLIDDDLNYDEERELDYDHYRPPKNNDEIDQIWDSIYYAFNPQHVHSEMTGCKNLTDCINRGNQHQFESLEEAESVIQDLITDRGSIFECPFDIRWKVNNRIINSLKDSTAEELNTHIVNFENLCKEKDELEAINAAALFRNIDIVAVTTTGRAKYNEMLKKVNFPILIVEEAAEVFEAHIVSSLSQQTEHVILIGDHEQLRPNPTVYNLSENYNLSMSMFERLIKNKVEHSTLNVQRRMRPEISKIMNYIYPDLTNHEIVTNYPSIKGMTSNLFFYDHKFIENTNEMMASKFNVEEAKFIVRFACYLLQHQYPPENITILTLYTGQLLQIKQFMSSNVAFKESFKKMRVVSVDNYQGEENDIILLSLVRSNPDSNIGFLKTSNRVCVALSRAKHGLFIFGNSQCLLGSKIQVWEDVIGYMKENNYIGDSLCFKCVNHNETDTDGNITKVKTLEDFSKVPEGGCDRKCDVRMECCHACSSMCHPYEKTEDDPTGHKKIKCQKPCERPMTCSHECSYKCHECSDYKQPCKFELEKTMEPCGHIIKIECHRFVDLVLCKKDCEKELACGHACKQRCHQQCSEKLCKEQVMQTQPRCGHEIEVDCCMQKTEETECYRRCDHILECGHQCEGRCGECHINGEHQACKSKCKRILICGHACSYPCTKNCPPCKQKICKTQCKHSKCPLVCGKICKLCKEKCDNSCEHFKCTKLCSEPCNRQQCNEPCKKKSPYCQKHPCMGLCGDQCPKICNQCPKHDETFEIMFGDEQEKDSKFVLLPDCNHSFEVKALDRYMNQEQGEGDTPVQYRQCPRCKTPIMKCKRYMNQINSTLNDVNAIKGQIIERVRLFDIAVTETQLYLERTQKRFPQNLIYQSTFERQLTKFHVMLKAKLKFANEQLSTDALNEVIQNINYINDVMTMTKPNNQSTFSTSEKSDSDEIITGFMKAENLMSIGEKQKERARALAKVDMETIIKAVGLPNGHWNKCRNGHYYVIADCGGANEEAKCPDCHEVIGGTNHVLAAGNEFASELGGVSAWDPQGFNARVARGDVDLEEIVNE